MVKMSCLGLTSQPSLDHLFLAPAIVQVSLCILPSGQEWFCLRLRVKLSIGININAVWHCLRVIISAERQGTRLSCKKSVDFIPMINTLRRNWGALLYRIALKNYPWGNLTKEVKDLYNANFKTPKKELKEDSWRWKGFLPCSWTG